MSDVKTTLIDAGIDASTLTTFRQNGPARIYALTVPGLEAVALWRALRESAPQTAHWPVLLGGEEDSNMSLEILENEEAPGFDEDIQAGMALEPEAWLAARKSEMMVEYDMEGGEGSLHGEWPEQVTLGGEDAFTIPRDILTMVPKESIKLALVPTTAGWEVPAYLGYGGWNACPDPAEHACLLKYWNDKYGAELIGLSDDVLEMSVTRPPATREAAMALAWEQFIYCEDIVYQGTQTLEILAATLLNGKSWFFWWD